MRLKIVVLALVVFAVALFATSRVLSGGVPTVRIGSFTADVGQEATVDLEVLNVDPPGLDDWDIVISYDPNVVSAKNCTSAMGGGFCNSSSGKTTVSKLGVAIPGLEGDFSLASIDFTCQGGGSSVLSVSVAQFNDGTIGDPQPINPIVQNGKVTCLGEPAPTSTATEVLTATETPLPVNTPLPEPSATDLPLEPTGTEEIVETPSLTTTLIPTVLPKSTSTKVPLRATPTSTPLPLLGDTDCDGGISSLDALLILQFSAAIINSLPCPENADISGDGEINPLDSALILQTAAGLI